ncbi:MAG TPA: enolase C-terminal domain-like protein [Gemmatimonadaceae bacterium]|nr:enolase C-terminal domain-like protein [Gemmatimonadaceae bacterium]
MRPRAIGPRAARARIERVLADAYTIPTDAPESDGTIAWDATTIVVVRVLAGGVWGLGYSYAAAAARDVIVHSLTPAVREVDAMDVPAAWVAMGRAVRNIGAPGIASAAIAGVDNALWDLKARLLGIPLVTLLGAAREGIAAYGSGGFTSYTIDALQAQLGGWAREGFGAVKMKIGRDPAADADRVRAAREAIGPGVELYVDANGAYTGPQALAYAERFAAYGVSWFEEPVSSDDLAGLRLLRQRMPAGMRVAAGEYGYDARYFRRMLAAGAVDVLQADATRCGGVSGFLRAAALSEAYGVPLSAHTAPSLHTHLCCAAPTAINVEFFHDHARIERMLFDGAREPRDGVLVPDRTRPGLGLELRAADARRFAA